MNQSPEKVKNASERGEVESWAEQKEVANRFDAMHEDGMKGHATHTERLSL